MQRLIDHGVNVNIRNLFYTTPLHLACQNDRTEVVRYLLKVGAAPEAPDEAGITPAQLTKREDIARALEEAVARMPVERRQPPPPPSA